MNTCGTCKHFGKLADVCIDPENDDYVPNTIYHECTLLSHLNKTGTEEKWSAIAGVIDGSGYYAAFCVREEFGCNQWAAKE